MFLSKFATCYLPFLINHFTFFTCYFSKIHHYTPHLEIQKVYELFVQMTGEFVVRPDYAGASEDGEYLIRRGVWTVSDNPKEFEYEQVYKKVNGKYLIYHDEFSYEE